MADLADLSERLAYYQHGGKDEGQRDIDKINAVFGTVGKFGTDIQQIIANQLAIKKAQLETGRIGEDFGVPTAKEAEAEKAKIASQTQAANTFNTELARRTQMRQQAGLPNNMTAEELQAKGYGATDTGLTMPQAATAPAPFVDKRQQFSDQMYGMSPDTARSSVPEALKTGMFRLGYVWVNPNNPKEVSQTWVSGWIPQKTGTNALGRPDTRNRPLATWPSAEAGYSRAFVKSIFPELKEGQDITVGELKDRMAAGRQEDLNRNKGEDRSLRLQNMVLRFGSDMLGDPILVQARKEQLNMGAVQGLVNATMAGNTVAAKALGTKMARAMGEVGVLTDSDVTKYVTSGKLSQNAADKLGMWIKGTPTDATLEEIVEITAVIKDAYAEKIQGVYNSYVNRLAVNNDITTDEAARRLDVPYDPNLGGGYKPSAEKPKPAAPPAPGGKAEKPNAPPPPPSDKVVEVKTTDEAERLPKGTRFKLGNRTGTVQ